MKHLQFSKGTFLFLDDLRTAEHLTEDVEFSYKFKQDLRIDRSPNSQDGFSNKRLSDEDFRKLNAALKSNNMTFGQAERDASPEVNPTGGNIEEDLERDDQEYNIDAEMDEDEMRAIESIREEEYTKAMKVKRDEDRLQQYLGQR
jgi:hypothetical protein